METVWHIEISEANLSILSKKMLGLTFFERRLREAKVAGVSKVIFSAPQGTTFPKTNSKFCAPFETSGSTPINAIQVPLCGILTVEKNPQVLLAVNSASDFKAAKKLCCKQIVQGSGAGWVAKKINKPISLPVSSLISYTFITPNMWTFLNMLIGLLSAFFIAQQGYVNGLIGGILLQLASIFDGVDGEIAKFRYETSKWGAVLDSIADNGTLVAFLTGIVFFYAEQNEGSNIALILTATMGVAFLLIARVWFFVNRNFSSNSLVTFDSKFLQHLPSSDFFVRVAKTLKDYIKKDFYSAVFFLFCVFNRREWILHSVFIVALGALVVISLIIHRFSPSKIRPMETR